MAFAKILCPTDFSDSAARAVAMAVRLASEHDAELILFHAYAVPVFGLAEPEGESPALRQQLAADASAGLAEAVDRATALGARKLRSRLASGRPWVEIIKAAKAEAADLIVVGSNGRSGLPRIALGSVAEMVARRASCPVLVVRGGGEPRPFGHILVPVDFSPRSRDAAELAIRLAHPGGAGVTLLHVVEAPVTWGELQPPEAYRDLDARGAARLEAWVKGLATAARVPVQSRVRIGSVGAQLLHAIDADRSIDLIVIGSHGRTGLKRAALGSIAEKTARHAYCPVLIVHHHS